MRLLIGCLAFASLWAQTPTDWLNRGVAAFRSAQYPEAVTDFQNALNMDPSSLSARLYLATAYMQQYISGADTPENRETAVNAEDNFLKVLTQDPSNRVAMNSIASLNLN